MIELESQDEISTSIGFEGAFAELRWPSSRAVPLDYWTFGTPEPTGITNRVLGPGMEHSFLQSMLQGMLQTLQAKVRSRAVPNYYPPGEFAVRQLLERVGYGSAGQQAAEAITDTEVDSSPFLTGVAVRLRQLSALAPDWDSYGAKPVSDKAIRATHQLLSTIRDPLGTLLGDQIQPFAIAPLADGGLQLEWRGPKGTLEVDIAPDGKLGYLLVEGQKDRSFEEGDDVPWNRIPALMRRVMVQ